MRDKGTPAELEYRRRLAVQRVLEGYTTQEVAEFLDVDPRSVRRWVAAFRQEGHAGLRAQPPSGRPPKLSHTQEKILRRFLAEKATKHGFPTDLWTGPYLAQLIQREFGVSLNPEYLTVWLRDRDLTPQRRTLLT
jgi:transposase